MFQGLWAFRKSRPTWTKVLQQNNFRLIWYFMFINKIFQVIPLSQGVFANKKKFWWFSKILLDWSCIFAYQSKNPLSKMPKNLISITKCCIKSSQKKSNQPFVVDSYPKLNFLKLFWSLRRHSQTWLQRDSKTQLLSW